MIGGIIGAARAAVTIYRAGVIVYELIRAELRSDELEPMPLGRRDVEHIQRQIASATSHKVARKK